MKYHRILILVPLFFVAAAYAQQGTQIGGQSAFDAPREGHQTSDLGRGGATIRLDESSELELHSAAVFTPYDATESVKWAIDFVVAPDRARDRQVMVAYDIEDVDAGFLAKLLDAANKRGLKIAVVKKDDRWNLRTVGEKSGYYGLAVTLAGEMPHQLTDEYKRKLNASITQAMIKKFGANVVELGPVALGSSPTYIAVSEPVAHTAAEGVAFVTSKGAWQ